MPTGAEVLPNQTERFEEALRLPRRLKAPHRPLPLPRWLIGVLRPIVQPLVLTVLRARQDLLDGWSVAG